ncbi:MAG: hypothetical protein DA407_06730 [Bacteroidetes bacterium]|nr:MAG: hypothetical protein DA407_06730 [Bacteroidota bacterium]
MIKYQFIIVCALLSMSCNHQEKNKTVDSTNIESQNAQNIDAQIGQYVVETFEDSKGNLWFGTLEKGVAKYDGNTLKYLTTADGLPSNRVVNIIEDSKGNLWLGTGNGLSKYDGKTFINFTTEDGICDNMVSNLLIDSKGVFWIGTWNGVCQFDGTRFKTFSIPYPTIETQINEDTKNWITEITEDSKGNIWIGRDGYGASKYDGNEFIHYTTKDGLYSNNVTTIEEDKDRHIWIGTRVAEKDNADVNNRFGKGGLNKFDGRKFIHFLNIDGVNNNDVYGIYNDHSDNLWITTLSQGIYKYDGETFENYNVPKSTMSILRDSKGTIWLGCAEGLFSINSKGIVNVTTNGPWE